MTMALMSIVAVERAVVVVVAWCGRCLLLSDRVCMCK